MPNDTNKPRVRFTVAELAVDAIAIKAAHGHPDYPVTAAEVDILLTEIKRLRLIEEHAGMLRDAVESIGAGHSTLAETIRGQCRLLVRAYDDGAKV